MKPLISFFVILMLFQSLLLGNLVKFELYDTYSDKWDIVLIHKQLDLDPFLIPGKEGVDHLQYKNVWIPYNFNKNFLCSNTPILPMYSEIADNHELRNNLNTIPVFILNATLRI